MMADGNEMNHGFEVGFGYSVFSYIIIHVLLRCPQICKYCVPYKQLIVSGFVKYGVYL